MGNLSKGFALLLSLILAVPCLSLLASAQTIPAPSVPQFTIELVDHSYDIPTVTSSTINPYSGKTETTTTPGQHVENLTLDVTIKNQPFLATINGNASYLYYNVRLRGHFGGEWDYPYSSFPTYASSTSGALDGDYSKALPKQSHSEYTVFSFPANYNPDDEIDFQVEAILAVQYSVTTYHYGGEYHLLPIQENTFVYHSSDWSPTQTFKMPQTANPTPSSPDLNSTSPSQTPSPTPANSNLTLNQTFLIAIGVAGVLAAFAAVGVVVYFRKHR